MNTITIHQSGIGADKLAINSIGNGLAYNVCFGEAGSPLRNIFFQGDDATHLRDEFDAAEQAFPEVDTRDVWLRVLDPYL